MSTAGHSAIRRKARILFTDGFRAAPGAMTWTAITTVITAIAQITYPIGIQIIVDGLAHQDLSGEITGTVVVSVLFTLSWALLIVTSVQGTVLTDLITVWISARIARLINALPGVEHFERPDYLAELDQLEERRGLLAAGPRQMLSLASIAVRTVGIAVLLGEVYAPLALLPLAGVPPYFGDKASAAIRRRSDTRIAERRRLAEELFGFAATAEPAKELRVYGLGGELRRRYDALTGSARRDTTRAATLGALVGGLGWLLYASAFAAAVAVIAIRAVHGQASPGQVVLAISLLRRAQLTATQAADAIGQLATTAAAADSLIRLEDQAAAAARGGAEPPVRLTSGITFQDVTFAYTDTGAPALQELNLHLPAGGTVAIVGDNGAGKSTLVKLLMAMYTPTSGRILVDGVDLASLDPVAWRTRTAAAFQDHVPWELMAGETIGIGDLPRLNDRPAVNTAVERAGVASLIDDLDGGLDTLLGATFTGGRQLSGGQWQKLALGRAMMRERPLLLVLDEPTASLDIMAEEALFGRYLEAARRSASNGAITILVSHRFSTVRMADLIIVMAAGRVIEAGSHHDLLRSGGTYAELFELQARAYR